VGEPLGWQYATRDNAWWPTPESGAAGPPVPALRPTCPNEPSPPSVKYSKAYRVIYRVRPERVEVLAIVHGRRADVGRLPGRQEWSLFVDDRITVKSSAGTM
jgi:hypothetical protein